MTAVYKIIHDNSTIVKRPQTINLLAKLRHNSGGSISAVHPITLMQAWPK